MSNLNIGANNILDIGAGPGGFARLLAAMFPQANIVCAEALGHDHVRAIPFQLMGNVRTYANAYQGSLASRRAHTQLTPADLNDPDFLPTLVNSLFHTDADQIFIQQLSAFNHRYFGFQFPIYDVAFCDAAAAIDTNDLATMHRFNTTCLIIATHAVRLRGSVLVKLRRVDFGYLRNIQQAGLHFEQAYLIRLTATSAESTEIFFCGLYRRAPVGVPPPTKMPAGCKHLQNTADLLEMTNRMRHAALVTVSDYPHSRSVNRQLIHENSNAQRFQLAGAVLPMTAEKTRISDVFGRTLEVEALNPTGVKVIQDLPNP